ncbi:MAG: PAS domain S-box protein [Candidatus Eisenbacteria bacterium]|nr:PAS domain S-box protein [Candidatus Eisenbacteria bacterium]
MPGKATSRLRVERPARATLRARLDDLRALIPEVPLLAPHGDAEMVLWPILELLEKKQRRLIEEDVRLAALRELTETLLRQPEEERTLRTVTLYLRHAYALAEVLLLTRRDDGRLQGYRARSGDGPHCEAVAWPEELLRGTAWESALGGETVRGAARSGTVGAPPCLPLILPLRSGARNGERDEALSHEEGGVIGVLAVRPAHDSGAGEDPFDLAELGFQTATLLDSVRQSRRSRQEQEFRECLLEAMGDGLLATDGNGRVNAANPAALSMLGLKAADVLGRQVEDLGGRAPALVRHCLQGLAKRERITQAEAGIASEGEKVPVSVTVVPLNGDDGAQGGIVATFSDLRPIRTMEAEVRRLDRLAALGRFAGSVAHEIRNPLAAIGAGVEFLSRALPAENQGDLKFVQAEIARLDRIVRDLLEPSRNQPLQRTRIRVEDLILRARQAVEPALRERNLSLIVEPRRAADGEAEIDVDVDRLLQVLVNLLVNAAEASRPGGRIEVGWEKDPGGGPSTLLWIQDGGAGIPPEHLAHIFEPFYSTKPTGTGLGLYVCRGIVGQHGGEIDIASEQGRGTRVTLRLPDPIP